MSSWIRKLLITLLALGLLGAIVYFALTATSGSEGTKCQRVEITLSNDTGGEALFLSPSQIQEDLTQRGIILKGKLLDSIELRPIEARLKALGVYEEIAVYKAPATQSIQIRLREKTPLFLVLDDKGNSYYVTEGRGQVKAAARFATYLPIVTGTLTSDYALQQVYDLVQALKADSYFNDYYGQIEVRPGEGISIIPRLGQTRIILGNRDNWAEKLRKWKIFASSVLQKRGMNAFSYVKLDYKGQVVAADRYPSLEEELDEEGERRPIQPIATPPSSSTSTALKQEAPAESKTPAKPAEKPSSKPTHKAEPSTSPKIDAKKEPKKEPKKVSTKERGKEASKPSTKAKDKSQDKVKSKASPSAKPKDKPKATTTEKPKTSTKDKGKKAPAENKKH